MGQWLSDHLGQTFVIENIARELGVDPKTLQKHFGEVIETAAARRKMDDLAALSERARGGSARAGSQTANELGAPVASSIPEQLPEREPASTRKGYEDGNALFRW